MKSCRQGSGSPQEGSSKSGQQRRSFVDSCPSPRGQAGSDYPSRAECHGELSANNRCHPGFNSVIGFEQFRLLGRKLQGVSSLAALRSTLTDLVGIDSTSARSNAGMIDYLDSRLSSMGFTSQRLAYVDETGVEKINLVGVAGGARYPPPVLALVAHTHCVPVDPDWKEALKLTEKNDRFYGRGACDTKAFLSAALVAANAAHASTLERPLLMIL